MYDCGFTKGNNWFRYRAAAIIIENGCVLFAGNELDKYKAFPQFMKDYLSREHNGIEHIVTMEGDK